MPAESRVFLTDAGIPGRVDFRHPQLNKLNTAKIIKTIMDLLFNLITLKIGDTASDFFLWYRH